MGGSSDSPRIRIFSKTRTISSDSPEYLDGRTIEYFIFFLQIWVRSNTFGLRPDRDLPIKLLKFYFNVIVQSAQAGLGWFIWLSYEMSGYFFAGLNPTDLLGNQFSNFHPELCPTIHLSGLISSPSKDRPNIKSIRTDRVGVGKIGPWSHPLRSWIGKGIKRRQFIIHRCLLGAALVNLAGTLNLNRWRTHWKPPLYYQCFIGWNKLYSSQNCIICIWELINSTWCF